MAQPPPPTQGIAIQRQIQMAMEQAQQAQAIQSIGGATPPVSTLTTSEAVESEILLNAAQQVVLQVGRPMHYTDIKRVILEKNLVASGINTTLETALIKDVHKPAGRFVVIDGQPGVFGVKGQPISGRAKPTKAKARPKPAGMTAAMNGMSVRYKTKYFKLKRLIKDMAYLNAAVCDEVNRVEEKVAKVREERRFLLKKVLQHPSSSDVASNPVVAKQPVSTPATHPASPFSGMKVSPALNRQSSTESFADSEKAKSKKKMATKKKTTKELLEENIKSKQPKKGVGKSGGKRFVEPIPLDNTGRPIFPIELGALTVYSLGEIIPDRAGFYTTDHIFPAGFCSTRVYASLKHLDQTCLYTCKIWEGPHGAKFEISPEDEGSEHVFSSDDINECHHRMLQALNQSRGMEIVSTEGKGPEFFGLTHSTVQNLIQSCPGARKCSHYKWVKFEVAKTEAQALSASEVQDDSAVHVDALLQSAAYQQATERQKVVRQQMSALEPTTSLRSLLTSGPLVQAP